MRWISEYQLFLFDLDGLLVNTEELHYQAYKNMRYPILIEIRDEDVLDLTKGIPPKEIIYNFPQEYVAKQAIELGDPRPPKTAVIKLIPVAAAPANP